MAASLYEVAGPQPGIALDRGMGQGRNATCLAQYGLRMTGIDIGVLALEHGEACAYQLGLTIDTEIDSADHLEVERNRWVIGLFYMHAWYRGAKPGIVRRLYDRIPPGGLLVIEGSAGKQKFIFRTKELLRDLPSFKVFRYDDFQGETDWASGEESRIVRFVGKKTL